MSSLPVHPAPEAFAKLAEGAKVVPVYTELAADFDTPLSAFAKIRDGQHAFLFESAESSAASGRYSILGSEPLFQITSRGKEITRTENGDSTSFTTDKDVLAELEALMAPYHAVHHGDLPPVFNGGLVGYLAFDAISQFEPSVGSPSNDDLGLPDAIFFLADTVLIFDHHLRKVFVVANAILDRHESVEAAYQASVERLDALLTKLGQPLHRPAFNALIPAGLPDFESNTTREEFHDMVIRGKEYITAGDIFQFVPSQRFETDFTGDPIDLYRSLRHVNPSPYLFILELEDFALVGSSPEVHVRAISNRIDIRPIAGTRWRGKTNEEDEALAQDLLADTKECAEHLMLVDLARNDVGRIAEHGSVVVDDFMTVEKYSHVMHIVSNVHGTLAPDASSYDVLRATFPAGTVSGAPKIRAMQIIAEMENSKRCAYAGAVGYFGFDGGLDSCIALRTCLLKDGKAYVQAGAGVVADSEPEYEYQETRNKAMALLKAISLAEAQERL